MPLQATSGAASYDAFGGGAAAVPNYIEDVFSTWLYTGNGSAQTITNGIDLSGKGGLVWIKNRDTAGRSHRLIDTVRGGANYLESNNTNAQGNYSGNITAFNSTGFSVGDASFVNESGGLQASWTFREQPKFFDVQTFTGNGTATNNISHNLGSVPGFIIVKCTSAAGYRWVCAASDNSGNYLYLTLNTTFESDASTVKSNIATSTTFNPGYMGVYFDGGANVSGETYVAYLFASNAGGFGLTGTDNVISCGSFTTDGSSNFSVNLGYEPQWILAKQSSGASNNWAIFDNMRGMSNTNVARLIPNSSAAETDFAAAYCVPTATGFFSNSGGFFDASETVIYIAIRRGPMKVPTVGTSVFSPIARTGTGTNTTITSGFNTDLIINATVNGGFKGFWDRLRGRYITMAPYSTNGDFTDTAALTGFDNMTGVNVGTDGANSLINGTSIPFINWMFRRAPSFFDEVCYTGTGSGQVINHNLGVTPELLIFKARNNLNNSGYEYWYTNAPNTTYALALNLDVGESYAKISSANSTTVSLGSSNNYVLTNQTYVAYLFATCAGVSKVFSYTGNGSSQTINCGFTGGSRWVMIKRTDATGDWYVWDSARGIIAGNDPHLSLNSTAAEVTTDDSVDTDSTGFIVNQLSATNINVSSATYIGIAIA